MGALQTRITFVAARFEMFMSRGSVMPEESMLSAQWRKSETGIQARLFHTSNPPQDHECFKSFEVHKFHPYCFRSVERTEFHETRDAIFAGYPGVFLNFFSALRDEPEASWRNKFLTQPPITRIGLNVIYKTPNNDLCAGDIRDNVECKTGLTLGVVWDALQEISTFKPPKKDLLYFMDLANSRMYVRSDACFPSDLDIRKMKQDLGEWCEVEAGRGSMTGPLFGPLKGDYMWLS